MDSLFYNSNKTTLSDLLTAAATKPESIVFANAYWGAIIAHGVEYGTYVKDVNHHYHPSGTQSYTETTEDITIPANGGDATVTYICGAYYDGAGHATSARTSTRKFKHGSPTGTAYLEATTEDITIPANGSYETVTYISGAYYDANGHAVSARTRTRKFKHGSPTGTTYLEAITEDITIPANGDDTTVTYISGAYYDANGHAVSARTRTRKFKHGDTDVTNGEYGKNSGGTLTWGDSFKIAYYSVNKQGHLIDSHEITYNSYFVSSSTAHNIEIASSVGSDANTIYFII